jgi:hypothetical protein
MKRMRSQEDSADSQLTGKLPTNALPERFLHSNIQSIGQYIASIATAPTLRPTLLQVGGARRAARS